MGFFYGDSMELTKEYIKENLLGDNGLLNGSRMFSKLPDDILDTNLDYKAKDKRELCYLILNDMYEPPICAKVDCNNYVKLINTNNGYREYCSNLCSKTTKGEKEVKGDFNKEYIKNNLIGKNGWLNSTKLRLLNLEPFLKKYNVNTTKELCYLILNDMVEIPKCLSVSCENKVKFSFSDQRYSHFCSAKCGSNSNITRDKYKRTCKVKYGVENVSHSPDIQKKIKENLSRAKLTSGRQLYISKLASYGLTWLPNQQYKGTTYKENGIVKEHQYKALCNRCRNITDVFYSRNRCIHCYPLNPPYSKGEKELLKFIKEAYAGEVISNDRSILKGKEVDIYIPDLKLAFEFNGTYWHSYPHRERNYHQNKTDDCLNAGISLIHIWEHDWKQKTEIVKSMILNKLHKTSNRIYARKCIVHDVDKEKAYMFLDNNHLHGRGRKATYVKALYHNDKLVSVITVSKSGEILRFASLLNTQIVGGFGKLYKQLKDVIKYTYADIDWSSIADKSIYSKYMKLKDKTQFQLYYYNQNDDMVYNREKYMKHKLKEEFGDDIDLTKTADEICIENNIFPIYRCGNYKFEV